MRKLFGPHLLWLTIIVLIAALLTRNLWSTRAWIETHDGIYHLIRQEVFTTELSKGIFPVRWASSLDHGFGLPLFNYIYPGPYLLGAPFSLLGLNSRWVIKLVEIGLYITGAFGVYFLFAKSSKWRATFIATIYLTMPYLLLNIFIRGALGEQMAIACMPWVILSLSDISRTKKLAWYHPLPYFLMLIAHNFLSFLFLPIYALLTYTTHKDVWSLVLRSFVVSVGLSSFFLIPMIAEKKFLYSVVSQDFTFSYRDHFVYPIQLLFGTWGKGYSLPGLNDQMSFALGFTNIIILIIGLIMAFVKRNKQLILWLVIASVTIFFMLPVSTLLWQIIPPLALIQFPWRLLSLLVIAIPFIAFNLFAQIKSTKFSSIIICILFIVSLYFGFRYTTPFYFQNNDQISEQLYLYRDGTTTSSRLEMLPKWGSSEVRYIGDDNVRVQSGSAQITDLKITQGKIMFTSDSPDSQTVYRIRRNYFPSWFARDESGKKFATSPSDDGLIEFVGHQGVHTYTIYVGSTMIEKLGNILSVISLVWLFFL